MKTLTHSDHLWNEIIFENRNKSYGAYDLRETYEQRLKRSFFLTLIFISLIAGLIIAYSISFRDIEVVHEEKILTITPIHTNKKQDEILKPRVEEKFQKQKSNNILPVIADRDTTPAIDTLQQALAAIPASDGHAGDAPVSEGTDMAAGELVPTPPTVIYEPWKLDKQPEFKGGMKAFYQFMLDHLHFPAAARENGLQGGTVYVSFVVSASGAVKDVKLIKGLGYGFDETVTGVMEQMPDWNPGMAHGEAVSTIMKLPVKFELQ